MDSQIAVLPIGVKRLDALSVAAQDCQPRSRIVPDEVPGAFIYNGHSQAVMMATPADLEDFAVGFSLTEQIVESAGQIAQIEAVEASKGIRVEMRVPDEVVSRLGEERNRTLVGRTGCGLCGVDALDQVEKLLRPVARTATVDFARIQRALAALSGQQTLNAEARAVHAAALA